LFGGDFSSAADFLIGGAFTWGFFSYPRMPPLCFSWPLGDLFSWFFSCMPWGDFAGPMIFFRALLMNAGLFYIACFSESNLLLFSSFFAGDLAFTF